MPRHPTLVLILLSLSAAAILVLIAYLKLSPQPTPAPTIPPIPTITPTASPSATPTPKPLSFAEMSALYGPCANLPVLMYHHIQSAEIAKQNGNANLTVNPETFEKHLAYLNDRGYASIGPADLIAFFNQGTSLPKKAILLTFDDAYSDFAEFAAPLLTRYSIKATVFVPTGLVDNAGYLSWSQISSLAGSGYYFANHTWSHQNMGTSLAKIKTEVDTAQTQLIDHGQNSLRIFAYPYGIVSSKATDYLSESGYQLGFTTQPGRILCAKKRLLLPRIRIGNSALSAYGL